MISQKKNLIKNQIHRAAEETINSKKIVQGNLVQLEQNKKMLKEVNGICKTVKEKCEVVEK